MSKPFGDIFAEEIVLGRKRKNLIGKMEETEDSDTGRLLILVVIFIFGLGLLLAKLFSLTIIEGDKYRKLSSGNRIRETTILAPRGIIYDRNGKPLVRNIPTFTLPSGQTFFENVPATLSSEVKESIARDYIYKNDAAHAVGFVSEVSTTDLKNQNTSSPDNNPRKLELGDFIGKMGVEQSYDHVLRGTDGKQLMEVDALGKEVRLLGNLDPVPGKSLTLTLDVDLQQIAAAELAGKKGAVVAENPKTGEIYALYSSPSFDPNNLVRSENIDKLLADPDNPFFDRAISGLYPPGSTFKIVLALAALESGAVKSDTQIEDTGIINVGPFSFSNWYYTQYGRKEGFINIVTAIKRSNDIFFYKTGETTGIETIAKWGKKIGLGSTLGIDINGEAAGIMPDPIWREKTKGQGWYLGDTYHVSIGQGDLAVTPLQVDDWANVIANNGRLCRPHLSNLGNLSNLCKDLGIRKETVTLVKEGMKEACAPGGTGWPLFNFKVQSSKLKADGIDFLQTYESTTSGKPIVEIPTACKTGTAEFGDPENKTHAWFTVFAPAENPQISVTVLVEGGGEGSNVAAPIAKKILEKWFGR